MKNHFHFNSFSTPQTLSKKEMSEAFEFVPLTESDVLNLAEQLALDESKTLHQKVVMLVKTLRGFKGCQCDEVKLGLDVIMVWFLNKVAPSIPEKKPGTTDENELFKWYMCSAKKEFRMVADLCENWGCANPKEMKKWGRGHRKMIICKECTEVGSRNLLWHRVLCEGCCGGNELSHA